MIAAHMDEIGLIVTKIEDQGFLRAASIGGVDERTLLAQEVTVFGKKTIKGVIGAKSPHLLDEDEKGKSVPLKDLFVDCGLSKEEITDIVNIGDIISINRKPMELQKKIISGKAFDNRVGITAMLYMLKEIERYKFNYDIYCVATVQEEVGLRGAITSTFGIMPKMGIAIDVCHGDMVGVSDEDYSTLGKGPSIALGPNIHNKVYEKLKEAAKLSNIPYQLDPAPGSTYTDAWSIQISQGGVPTGLVSIPLRYMHTSVETVDIEDIKFTGELLASFISRIDNKWMGELTCY